MEYVFNGKVSFIISKRTSFAILLCLSLRITLLLKPFRGKTLRKTIVDFLLIAVTSDFQHWSGICLMSAEIPEVSKVSLVFLVSETTAFYEKL